MPEKRWRSVKVSGSLSGRSKQMTRLNISSARKSEVSFELIGVVVGSAVKMQFYCKNVFVVSNKKCYGFTAGRLDI